MSEQDGVAEPVEASPGRDFYRRLFDLTPNVWVTPGIIVVNFAVFAIMLASGVHFLTPTTESLIQWGANYGPKTTNGEWWRLFTCTFLHIGIIHLLLNMWVLWDAGRFVERLVGNAGFVVAYIVSGLMGSLASISWNPSIVSAGASGAVFGVYGTLLGFVLRRRDSIPMEVLAPLRNSALAFLGYNLVYGLGKQGIDVAAHLGGLAAGFLCGLAMSQSLAPEAVSGRRIRNALVAAGGAALVFVAAIALQGIADVPGERARLGAVEKKTLERFNSAVGKARNGEMTEAELADFIEQEVLPDWRAARTRFASLKHVPAPEEQVVSDLTQYMKLREEGWVLLAEALREQDAGKMAQAREKQTAASQLAKNLGGKR